MPSSSAVLLVVLGLAPLLEHQADQAQTGAEFEIDADSDSDTDTDTDLEADTAYAGLRPDAQGVPRVTSLAEVLAHAPPTLHPAGTTRIRHRVRPRERITQIAARYGVTPQDVVEWNHLDPREPYPKGYWRIRIDARRIPPPRLRVHYAVQPDEDWGDVAAKFRVEQPDLRAWNWERRGLSPGRVLTVWVDPGAPQTMHPGQGPLPPATFEVPGGGLSKGYPDQGRLIDGVLVPDSPLYTKRVPDHGLYTSTHTARLLLQAFAAFRHDTGFAGEVVIGAASRRRGGHFHPHVSHQSGRDVDIRLPRLEGSADGPGEPNEDEIDWHATWGLIRALTNTGQVARIFLDVALHRRLYEAARQLGESPEAIHELLQWPSWNARGTPVVRHSKGHDGHIHVRFACGPDEPQCKSRRRE